MKSSLKSRRFVDVKDIESQSPRVLKSITLKQFSVYPKFGIKNEIMYKNQKIKNMFYVYVLEVNICELIPGTFLSHHVYYFSFVILIIYSMGQNKRNFFQVCF